MKEYERRSGKTPAPLLQLEELWECNLDAWITFLDLCQNGQFSYSELNSYCEMAGLNKVEMLVKFHALLDVKREYDGTGKISSSN